MDWVAKTDWVESLAADPATQSNTGVCLKVVDARVTDLSAEGQAEFAKKLAGLLEKEGAAFDAGSYRAAPPGLRIWCGATVERGDLEALTPWLDWAFEVCVAELAIKAA
jgi:phosphoserine aminotransferase